MNAVFRPHGKFSTHVEGRLMVSDITGPWNRELVEYWGLHSTPAAKALSETGPFVGIAIIYQGVVEHPILNTIVQARAWSPALLRRQGASDGA